MLLRPIVEIMFSSFALGAADQLFHKAEQLMLRRGHVSDAWGSMLRREAYSSTDTSGSARATDRCSCPLKSLVLYDFGIHWFDIVACFMGSRRPLRVYASTARTPGQTTRAPLLAQVHVEYEEGPASLFFDASTKAGPRDSAVAAGTQGTVVAMGPDLDTQVVTYSTSDERSLPVLSGTWFPDEFHGTMGELLAAVKAGREPTNNARENLKSLELCFAAVASAVDHQPFRPGSVRTLRE